MKKTYRVKVTFKSWDVIEVEAENRDEARELAEDMAGDMSLNEMNVELENTVILTC